MPEQEVKNINDKVTLFHGTSSLFLKSILSAGLGSVCITEQYPVLSAMQEMISHIDETSKKVAGLGISNARWSTLEASSKAVVRQSMTGMSFQHDCLYASNTPERAANYATNNRCGSEILSRCRELYDICRTMWSFRQDEDFLKKYSTLHSFFTLDVCAPIVIKFSVEPFYLQHENGRNLEDVFLNALLNKKTGMTFSVRVLKTIPPDQLKYYIPIRMKTSFIQNEYNYLEIGNDTHFLTESDLQK